jgi:hypothetical protein
MRCAAAVGSPALTISTSCGAVKPCASITALAPGGGWASDHEDERASSRLALRGGDVWFPTEGQFPESLAKLLFAVIWRHKL